jgi:tetratricopeptide (TPR) repeat protein
MRFRLNAITASCLALLAGPGQAGTWHLAETEHFRVYSKRSPDELVKEAAVLEDYRTLLDALTTRQGHGAAEAKLDIYLLNGIGESQPFESMSRGIVGQYVSNSGRVAAFSVADAPDSESTLLHEYAHHYMRGTAINVYYPGWYSEGFAEYFSLAKFSPTQIQVGGANVGRGDWLAYSEWMPIDRVLIGKFRIVKDIPRFYAQSWLMTHYLLRVPGMPDKLAAYLKAMTAGQDNVAAFRDNIMEPTKFQAELRRYLSERKMTMTSYTRSPKTAAEVKLTRLPDSADPMLLYLTSLEFGLPRDKRAGAVNAVRSAAARFPGDPLAERTLAFAEMQYGDRAQGIQMLDRLIAASPADATLLRWRGDAEWPREGSPDDAAGKAARKHYARAFKADPNDWRTLYRYAMVEDPYARPLAPGTLDVLLRAQNLAPQVPEIRLATAVALVRADRLADAGKVLEPIANTGHDGEFADAADDMLAKVKAGDSAGALTAANTMAALIRKARED